MSFIPTAPIATNMTDFENRVSTAEAAIPALQSANAQLTTDKAALVTANGALTADDAAKATTIAGLTADKAALTGQLSTTTAALSAASTALSTAQAQLATALSAPTLANTPITAHVLTASVPSASKLLAPIHAAITFYGSRLTALGV